MQKNLLPLFLSVLFFTACKEKGPTIDFGGGARAFDTSYIAATPETPQPKRVLLEEFTGVTCPNCPDGHAKIAALEAQFPEKVIAVGIHPFGQGQANPLAGVSKYDFRTEDGTQLVDKLGGIIFLPSGAIDRTKFNNTMLDNRSAWSANAATRITLPTPVNIEVTSSYEPDSRDALIQVHTAFTASVSKKLLLHILIVEDKITDMQEYPTRKDTNYVHNHILRDYITTTSGAGIMDSIATKEAGRVFDRTLIYTLPQGWNPANCKVIAFITSNEPNETEVIQVAKGDLE